MDSLCVLPFIHFNLLPNGQASVCCVSTDPLLDDAGNPLNVRERSLGEIWESKALRDVREQMLAGEKPKQCIGCYKIEDRYGFGSHRTGQNSLFLANNSEESDSTEWSRFPKVSRGQLKADMGGQPPSSAPH